MSFRGFYRFFCLFENLGFISLCSCIGNISPEKDEEILLHNFI